LQFYYATRLPDWAVTGSRTACLFAPGSSSVHIRLYCAVLALVYARLWHCRGWFHTVAGWFNTVRYHFILIRWFTPRRTQLPLHARCCWVLPATVHGYSGSHTTRYLVSWFCRLPKLILVHIYATTSSGHAGLPHTPVPFLHAPHHRGAADCTTVNHMPGRSPYTPFSPFTGSLVGFTFCALRVSPTHTSVRTYPRFTGLTLHFPRLLDFTTTRVAALRYLAAFTGWLSTRVHTVCQRIRATAVRLLVMRSRFNVAFAPHYFPVIPTLLPFAPVLDATHLDMRFALPGSLPTFGLTPFLPACRCAFPFQFARSFTHAHLQRQRLLLVRVMPHLPVRCVFVVALLCVNALY